MSTGDIHAQDQSIVNIAAGNITQTIQQIHQHALSAVEEAQQAQAAEAVLLASGVARLVEQLQDLASARSSASNGNPYRGLLEYRMADAETFFGRQQAIRELWERLHRGRLTVLHAESGAGKSSLLQAGIAPRLIAAGDLPLLVRPYDQNPAWMVKRAFVPDLPHAPGLQAAPLREFLHQVCNVLGKERTLYIALDQFEEAFTRLDEQDRQAFVQELAECLEDETLPVGWTLALRSEFFSDLAKFQPRLRNPFDNEYRLKRLSRLEAVEVVERPAEMAGICFEDGLIEAILDDLGGQDVAPPQLQLVCSALYQDLSEGANTIRLEAYEQEGGAEGILRSHLSRVLQRQFEAAERKQARYLLEALVSSDQRRLVRLKVDLVQEMQRQGATADQTASLLESLTDNRLLRSLETEEGDAYELAHDYLLGEIQLDPEVQARKAAQELLEQELRAFQRTGSLIAEERLNVILPYVAEISLSQEAQMLLEHSQQESQRLAAEAEAQRQHALDQAQRLARTQQQRALVFAVGAVVSLVLLVVAVLLFNRSQGALADLEVESTTSARNASIAGTEKVNAVIAQGTAEAESTRSVAAEAEALLQRDAAQQALEQSKINRAQQLASQSQILGVSVPQRRLLVALEALRVVEPAPNAAYSAFREALTLIAGRPVGRYTQPLTVSAHSLDGRWLAGGSQEGTIYLWDLDLPQLEAVELSGLTGPVSALVFSQDGRWLAAGAGDFGNDLFSDEGRPILVWDLAAVPFEAVELGRLDSSVSTLAISPKGTWLAAGSYGGEREFMLWNLKTPQAAPVILEWYGDINAFAFSPEERWLAVGWGDAFGAELTRMAHPVLVYDLRDLSAQPQWLGGGTPIYALAFSPEGRWLAAGDYDGRVDLYDMSQTPPVSAHGDFHSSSVSDLLFSPSSGQLISAGGYILIPRQAFDLSVDPSIAVGYPSSSFDEPLLLTANAPVGDIALSSDGKWLVSGNLDGSMNRWEMGLLGAEPELWYGHEGGIRSLQIDGTNHTIYTFSEDRAVRAYDLAEPAVDRIVIKERNENFNNLVFSPDGSWFALQDTAGTLQLWARDKFEALARCDSCPESGLEPDYILQNPKSFELALAFSPDGLWLAGGGFSGSLQLWDLSKLEVTTESAAETRLAGYDLPVGQLAFSPDSASLAIIGTDSAQVWLWDAQNPDREPALVKLGEKAKTALTFVPGTGLEANPSWLAENWLAVGDSSGAVYLWNIAEFETKAVLLEELEGRINQLEFSQDGRWLAAHYYLQFPDYLSTVIFDLEKFPEVVNQVETFPAEEKVAFSPDGRWLVTQVTNELYDYEIHLHDLQNLAAEPVVLGNLRSEAVKLGFTPDGAWLYAATEYDFSGVTYWRMDLESLVPIACQVVGRNLTQAEWRQYFPGETYRSTCNQWPAGE